MNSTSHMMPTALQASPLGEVNTTSSTSPEATSMVSSPDLIMSASTPTVSHAPPLSANASHQEPSPLASPNIPPPTYLTATTSPIEVAYEVYPAVLPPRKKVFSRLFGATQTGDVEFGPVDNSTANSGAGRAKCFVLYCALCVIITGTFAGYMVQAMLMGRETGEKTDE